MNNLLVEILVEELPPKALENLGNAFGRVLARKLADLGLVASSGGSTVYASPRRLAVHVCDVARQAPDTAQSQKLMPVSVGLDASGKATPALLKKLQALGAQDVAVADLCRKIDGKAEITEDVLVGSGLVRRALDGIRVLAKGAITSAVKITVSGASAPAIAAVAAAGGVLTVTAPAPSAEAAE